MELYVLTLDMYHEWALDCGASDIIGVFDNTTDAAKELLKCIYAEIKDGRYFEETLNDIEIQIDNFITTEDNIYFDIYENAEDYENGKNMGTFKIEKRILNVSGYVGK